MNVESRKYFSELLKKFLFLPINTDVIKLVENKHIINITWVKITTSQKE